MAQNEERRQRILDAAAMLIGRYGYDKTTIDDIAGEAGVSKGAVYLEFRSKEALFEELLLREMRDYAREWIRRIDEDPQGGTIGAMYKNSLYAMSDNHFMGAMLGRDKRTFGNYLHKRDNFFQRMQERQEESSRYTFVKLMQEAGAIRNDLDARVVAHIMNIIGCGMLAVDDVTPAAERPSLDETLEGIAVVMDAALTPLNGVDSSVGKALLHKVYRSGMEQYDESVKEVGRGDNR